MDEHTATVVADRAHAHIRRPRKPRAAARPTPAGLAMLAAIVCGLATSAGAQTTKPDTGASFSKTTREDAIKLIPLDKLDDDGREKVASVLSQISIFRRLPTQVIECDPELYLFLIEHPDMVVNMWEVMDVSDMRLEKTGEDTYRANDGVGTAGHVEYLYRSYDTHVMYAAGSYSGPLFVNQVQGKCLMVLKTGYVREPNDRYHITCRLDTFIQLKNVGLEIVARTFQPLVGKTADHNFRETASFFGLVSRSAEVNPGALQQLTAKLTKVDDADREAFSVLADKLSEAAVEREVAKVQAAKKTTSGQRKTAMKPAPKSGR